MKVLLAASEVAPIVKLGGLGDVMGSLPKALEGLGVNVDVIVPFYPAAKVQNLDIYKSLDMNVGFAGETMPVEVFKTKLPGCGVDVFLLKNARYFNIGGSDAFLNNVPETEMFAFFDRCVVDFIKNELNVYDLVHCNDWHTGMITHLLEDELGAERPATLFTIHNLSYQGVGPEELVRDLGIAPGDHQLVMWDLDDHKINLMLQAITSSDYVSTVSPSYANEILFKDIGGELSEILMTRKDRFTGILNGIDYSSFKRDFDKSAWKVGKTTAKKNLREKLGLEEGSAPIFSFISRLDPNQKGLNILLEAVPELLKIGAQFVLLGTGDPVWEGKFNSLQGEKANKARVSINIKFDNELAREIYQASDFILVPSRYEPCGLTQMIAMHYGTLPVVRAVGGLKDSVTEGKNGFLFDFYSSADLLKAVKKACKIFSDAKQYEEMVENAFDTDFSWTKSAKEYMKLYEKVAGIRE